MSRRAKGNPHPDNGSPARSVPIASPGGRAIPPEVRPHNRWLTFAVCLFLALVVWAVFGQTLRYEFVNFDDDVYIYDNPAITHGLSWHGVAWTFTHTNGPDEWLPLTAISRMLDCQLYGLHPGGHHLTNVLLHAATAILLFLVLRNMTGAFWPAAFVAAVFAIHPLRVESVAWVTERKNVLSGLFFMLTLGAYVRYSRERGTGSRNAFSFFCFPFYWLALLLFILGLLSKDTLVTLPFVLLLIDFWPLQRFNASTLQRLPHLLLEKIPFLVLAAAFSVVVILTHQSDRGTLHSFGIASRTGNALVSYVAYIGQMLYPAGLAAFYPHPGNHLPFWKAGLSLLALFLVSAGVIAARRKHPYLLVGWLWYLGMLLPVIGLMQVGAQARADRHTYLPQIGLYILVAWGAVELCGSWRHRRAVLGSAAGVILAGLMAAAYVQTGYWKNSVTLWTHTLACTPENPIADSNLGNALMDQWKLDEAIPYFERALQLNPDYPDVWNNLGIALAREGKLDDAVKCYGRALQLKPDYAEAHCNLGNALARQGKLDEAVQHFERTLQLKPDYAEAHCDLGIALVRQGKLDEAIEHFERAVQINPDYAYAQSNLGVALARQGKLPEAIEHFERAVQINPDYAEARCNLGNALAAQGRLNEAIQQFQEALDLAAARNNVALAEAIRTRLKSFQQATQSQTR